MLRHNHGYKEQVKRTYNDKDIHVSISAKLILFLTAFGKIILTLRSNSRFLEILTKYPKS